MTTQNDLPRIDVWGSCVSRDTLEYMPEFAVGAYVARQSAIVALSSASKLPVPLDTLESNFQRRMLVGDMKSDAGARIEEDRAVCVLVDLVDERRGVWQFPDSTYLTNSVEAFRTGVDVWGPEMGARLIEFGTDEHFELWKQGFRLVARRMMRTMKPIILLDIAWAEVFEGQTRPQGLVSSLGGVARRSQRKVSHMLRVSKRERSIISGIIKFNAAPTPLGDRYVRLARDANVRYRRYIDEAQKFASVTVQRTANDVRMNKSHKWGIGPYHYSNHDYERISDDLYGVLGQMTFQARGEFRWQ